MQIIHIPSRSFSALPPIAAAILAAVVWFLPSTMAQNGSAPAKPPAAPLRPVTDDYFGIAIKDPYRYLENLDDPDVKTWLKGHNDYTLAETKKLPSRPAAPPCIKKI